MNKRPSQRVTTLITGVEDGTIAYSDLLDMLKIMRDQFQKEEAEAYRGSQANNEYKVINKLIEKSNKLTGR